MFGNRKNGSFTAANLNTHLVHCIGQGCTTSPFSTGEFEDSILIVDYLFIDLGGRFRVLAGNIESFLFNKQAVTEVQLIRFICFFNNLFNFHSTVHENFVL